MSGILLSVWLALVKLLFIVNFFIVLISTKRNKGIARFCEIWNTQTYVFLRYITFVSNKSPFPFPKPTLSEVAELLRLFPEYSLEVCKKQAHWRDMGPTVVENRIEALREAGLK